MENLMHFTHFDNEGNAIMVDVSEKAVTEREAIAVGKIKVSRECFFAIKDKTIQKGDVFSVARIAGIMGAKRTSEWIPLCHNLGIMKVAIDFRLFDKTCEIETICTVKAVGKTGVEMEALTGVSVSLLTIYDMCKAIDKSMEIHSIYLQKKTGGKSGIYENVKEGKNK